MLLEKVQDEDKFFFKKVCANDFCAENLLSCFTEKDLIQIFNDVARGHLNNDEFIFMEFLNNGRSVYPECSLIKDFSLASSLEELEALISRGSFSVRLNNIHRVSNELMKWCEKTFSTNHRVFTINLYASPSGSEPGLGYHSDHERVYVWQCKGEKKWFFPINSKDLPLKTFKPSSIFNASNMKAIEFVSKEGECLLVNPGVVHRAVNSGKRPSFHLTFAEDVLTVDVFLKYLYSDLISVLDSAVEYNIDDLERSAELIWKFFHERSAGEYVDEKTLMRKLQWAKLLKNGKNKRSL